MSRKLSVGVLLGATVAVAAVVAGYAGGARSATSATPLPSSSCGPVVYKGSGSPDFIIASDLPLQGAIRHQTVQVSRAEIWALANAGWKAGSYKIGYQSCDDSTAQTGGWDSGKCATNARLYAAQQVGHRRARDVQLGLREDRGSDPEPREPRSARHGQPGEHEPGTHEEVGSGRAAEVLPDGRAQLRTRRRDRRHPGPRGRNVDAGTGSQEGLRPQRQADLRLRRRDDVQERGEEARHHGRRLPGLGREAVELRGARKLDQGIGCAGRLPRRHRLQQRREADAGHQVRQSEDQASDA